jgi:hypothetical protein
MSPPQNLKETKIIRKAEKMARNKGDEDILWILNYSHIAKWAGLKVSTVRTYSQQGQFDRKDIESVLEWVNTRRKSKELPLIGIPAENSSASPMDTREK